MKIISILLNDILLYFLHLTLLTFSMSIAKPKPVRRLRLRVPINQELRVIFLLWGFYQIILTARYIFMFTDYVSRSQHWSAFKYFLPSKRIALRRTVAQLILVAPDLDFFNLVNFANLIVNNHAIDIDLRSGGRLKRVKVHRLWLLQIELGGQTATSGPGWFLENLWWKRWLFAPLLFYGGNNVLEPWCHVFLGLDLVIIFDRL
jgi:hypothetical protein